MTCEADGNKKKTECLEIHHRVGLANARVSRLITKPYILLINLIQLAGNNKKQPKSEKETLSNGHTEMNGHSSDDVADTKAAAGTNTETAVAKTDEKDANETTDESDVLEIIQDVGFSVQILSPGIEPLSIQVSSMELVQEIHQLLMDREDTCHRTCFSLQLDGVTLDNFAELKNIDGLQEGSTVKVVEEPYTMREARIHVRHVRDLLKSMDPADAYNGVDCSSLTFLHTITQGSCLKVNNLT